MNREALQRVYRRLYAVVRRARVTSWEGFKNPRAGIRGAQSGKHTEVFLNYGRSYSPPPGVGSEVIQLACQGDEDHSLSPGATGGTATPAPRYQGDNVLYGINGSLIQFNQDGSISITATAITLNGIDWDTHEHTGVQTGGGNTGGPV